MEMEAKSVNGCQRDVVVDDAVETKEGAFSEGRTAEVAALELTFGALEWEPWFLCKFGGVCGLRQKMGERGGGCIAERIVVSAVFGFLFGDVQNLELVNWGNMNDLEGPYMRSLVENDAQLRRSVGLERAIADLF